MACTCLLWAFLVSLCLGFGMAQTVTQSQSKMSVQETEVVILDCIYDTSERNYYLFWYQQPPSGQMIPIIRQEAFKQQNATEHRFSVNFQKEAKSFSLKISDSQLTDAAMYFCAFMRHSETSSRARLTETSALRVCKHLGGSVQVLGVTGTYREKVLSSLEEKVMYLTI